jgi:hypothetical protein
MSIWTYFFDRFTSDYMNKKTQINALVLVIVIFTVALACSNDETQKANNLVDDANVSITDANKNSDDGLAKIYSMEAMLPRIKSQNDLNSARSVANDCISVLTKAKDKYTEATSKLQEAGKMSINEKLKEYLDLKAQEMKKRSEAMETAIREPQALIDSNNVSEYTFKVKSITESFKNLRQEADDLAKKADKLQEENKDVIKK